MQEPDETECWDERSAKPKRQAGSQQQMGMRRTIELGAMSPTLTKQLRGLKVPKARLLILDKLADSLTWCYVHGLITEPEHQRAGQRLIALVGKEVRKAHTAALCEVADKARPN